MAREPFDPDQMSAGMRNGTGDEELEALARRVIGCMIDVHRALGPGYTEPVYQRSLSLEFEHAGIEFQTEAPITVVYRDIEVGRGRTDFLVENKLVLELKSIRQLAPVDRAQTLAYLKALDLRLGLLINFNVAVLKDGIERIINPHKS